MSKQDHYDLMDVKYKPKEYGGEWSKEMQDEINKLKNENKRLEDQLDRVLKGWKDTQKELNELRAENLKLSNRLWKEIMRDD